MQKCTIHVWVSKSVCGVHGVDFWNPWFPSAGLEWGSSSWSSNSGIGLASTCLCPFNSADDTFDLVPTNGRYDDPTSRSNTHGRGAVVLRKWHHGANVLVPSKADALFPTILTDLLCKVRTQKERPYWDNPSGAITPIDGLISWGDRSNKQY